MLGPCHPGPMPLRIRDIMTPDPDVATPGTPLVDVAEKIIERRYSGMPVCDDDGHPVGVVEVGDLLPRPGQVPATNVPVLQFHGEWVEEQGVEGFLETLRQTKVEAVMRTEFLGIGPAATIGEALTALVVHDHRRVLVVSEDGEDLLGVVTRTDLLRILAGGV